MNASPSPDPTQPEDGQPPRHTAWLLRIFPRAWRDRYADEFLAMIADQRPGVRDTLDILLSAADARLRPQGWATGPETERQLVLQSATSGPSQPPVPARGTPLRERSTASRRFTRRVFLRNALLGSAVVAAAGAGVGAVTFTAPNKTGVFGKEVLVAKESIPAVGDPPYKHLPGKFWLINNQDGLLALYWKCPHLGCTVPWNEGEGQFHCPCHQSIYDRNGVLTAGPAPRPMDLMAMRTDALGNLIVNTGDITTRSKYAPDQAFKLTS